MHRVIKGLYGVTAKYNVDLYLMYVPSKDNPADAPSRLLSYHDCQLTVGSWAVVAGKFGPHTVDIMALDSNVMKSPTGEKLRHFSPFPMPGSAGTNVFAQEVENVTNPYVFPSFYLILPLLSLFKARHVGGCTMVLALVTPRPVWRPVMTAHRVDECMLGERGSVDTVLVPSRKGFVSDKVGLRWPLLAVRLILYMRFPYGYRLCQRRLRQTLLGAEYCK